MGELTLQKYLDEQEQTEQDGFKIDDDQKANWALRKIAQYQKQIEDNNALAEEEISKIEAWNRQVNDEAQQSIDYFQGLLAEYGMKKREEDPKWKSSKLPNGRIRFKKQQAQWKYDEKTLVESLKQVGMTEYIKVEEKPVKGEIKKVLQVVGDKAINPDTGEVVEGITVEERPEKFEVITE